MVSRAVLVRFSRSGARDGVALAKDTEYQISVDGTEYEVFRSPWDEDELDEVITVLRNESDEDTSMEKLAEIGGQLGDALRQAAGFTDAVRPDADDLTVYWHLDFPELARIPWEIACWWRPPHEHILLTPGISFVRAVPMFDPGLHVEWPTGVKRTLKVLYVWGEADRPVPKDVHLEALQAACDAGGVELAAHQVATIAELQGLYEEGRHDFVHILAHGAMAPNGDWGLQLSKKIVKGEQIARALRVERTTPALVTLAACDSGNETSNSFGSVAYRLHANGIPMVLASQFRLRVSASNASVSRVYAGLLAGDHPLQVLAGLRNQLASADTEAWANEVLYTKYTLDELNHNAKVATQQGALRRARVLAKQFSETPPDEAKRQEAKDELRRQIVRLQTLADDRFEPAETYGLLGSLARRIAYIGADDGGAGEEALRLARDFYERGLRADMNSHYCGVNALHLSWLIGDRAKVDELEVIVDWAVQAALEQPDVDFWVHASAGEAKVYRGEVGAAAEHYRAYVAANGVGNDVATQRENLRSSRKQLEQLVARRDRIEADEEGAAVLAAAKKAIEVLDSALESL